MVKLLILLFILASCAQETKPTTPKNSNKNGSVVFSDFEFEVKKLSEQGLHKKHADLTESSKELESNKCVEGRFHYTCLNDHIDIYNTRQKMVIVLVEKHNRTQDPVQKEELRKQVTIAEENTSKAADEMSAFNVEYLENRDQASLELLEQMGKIEQDGYCSFQSYACKFQDELNTLEDFKQVAKAYSSVSNIYDDLFDHIMSGMLNEELFPQTQVSLTSNVFEMKNQITKYLDEQELRILSQASDVEEEVKKILEGSKKLGSVRKKLINIQTKNQFQLTGYLKYYVGLVKNIKTKDILIQLKEDWIEVFKDQMKDESINKIIIYLDHEKFIPIRSRYRSFELSYVPKEDFDSYLEYSLFSKKDSRLIIPKLTEDFSFRNFYSIYQKIDRESLSRALGNAVPKGAQLDVINISVTDRDTIDIKLLPLIEGWTSYKVLINFPQSNTQESIEKLNFALKNLMNFNSFFNSLGLGHDSFLNDINIFQWFHEEDALRTSELIDSFSSLITEDSFLKFRLRDLLEEKKTVLSLISTQGVSKVESFDLPEGLKMIQMSYNPKGETQFIEIWHQAQSLIK